MNDATLGVAMRSRRVAAACLFVAGAALAAGGPEGPPLQSAAQAAPQDEQAHFHHVHLNLVSPEKAIEFYAQVFGAVPIKFRGTADALFTERSFILLNKVAEPAPSDLTSGIWHIGWGGVDVPNEYEWWKAKGLEFNTSLTKLGESNYYMYLVGPGRELIEIYSGEQNHRFNHVHLLASDVNATSQWYADHLGLALLRREVPRPTDPSRVWVNGIRVDNVTMYVFGKPDTDPPPSWWSAKPLKVIGPTQGRVIDHIAFSYRAIDPVLARLEKAGIRIVEPIATREPYGLRSFFVLGPDNVLVEIVEAKPIPETSWEREN